MKRRDLLKGSIVMPLGMMSENNAGGAVDENPFPPKKIIKKTPSRYSPLAYLEKVHDETVPALAFSATTQKEAEIWQKKLRIKLWELIGESHVPGIAKPSDRLLEKTEFDDLLQFFII